METDKFIIKIKLSNGIWQCNCTGIDNDGVLHYEVDIITPAAYRIKKLTGKTDFIFQKSSFDFAFSTWQFADDEYKEVLEEELSNKIIRRLL